MKQIIHIVLIITLSTLSACDHSPAPEQTQPDTAKDLAPADTHAAPPVDAVTANPPLAAGQYLVDLSDNGVVIRANQVNELVLFKGVADKAKFQLLAENFAWKSVSVDIHAETLHVAVVELVSAYPYEIVHAPDESGQKEILSEVVIGKPDPVMKQKDGDRRKASDPGKEALLYIKELTPLDQQQAYLEKLQDPTPAIRAAAAKKIKPSSASLPVLTDMLANDSSPEVRIATTWSIEVSDETEAPQAIEALVKCLDDKDLNVVVECIVSLEFIGDETTIVHLQPLLTHPDERVRTAAFEAVRTLQ